MLKNIRFSKNLAWVLIFSFCVVLLTTIPYLIAGSQHGGVFTGFLIGVEDGNSYIAKMLAGGQGDWLFRSPYTTAPQSGALIYLPYLLLGKLLGPGAQHGSLVLLFHAFRVLAIILLCFSVYDFLSYLISEEKLRRLGLALITLGTGLGWVLLFLGISSLLGSIPLDFYSPEAFGFLAIFSLPHLVLARALLLWGLLDYLKSNRVDENNVRYSRILFTAILWLLIALTHLITAVLGLILILAHFIFINFRQYLRKKNLKVNRPQIYGVAGALLGVGPVLAFNLWLYGQDTYLRAWAGQNLILSPNPLHYLVAYGLVLPFAYFGLRKLLKQDWIIGSFFLAWLVLLPFLLYAPVGLQRRMSEGAWAMFVLLALFAFDRGIKKQTARLKDRRELWLFSMAIPSTLILLTGSLLAAQKVETPIFRPESEVRSFEELRALAAPDEVVLTSYATGNALPAWAPLRVVAGHGPESIDLERLLPKIKAVYQGRTPEDTRLEFLQKYQVDYIFWGPNERALGSWKPGSEDYLQLVVNEGDYEIYRVSDDAIN